MAKMSDVRHIVWSLYWRSALIGIPGGIIVGGVLGGVAGVVCAATGQSIEDARNWAAISSGVGGAIMSFFVLNYVFARTIGKTIGGKKLVLLDAVTGGEI